MLLVLGSEFITIKMHWKWNCEYQPLPDRIHDFHTKIGTNLGLQIVVQA